MASQYTSVQAMDTLLVVANGRSAASYQATGGGQLCGTFNVQVVCLSLSSRRKKLCDAKSGLGQITIGLSSDLRSYKSVICDR